MLALPDCHDALCRAVRAGGFLRVCVDLQGFRSGSLNVLSGVGAAADGQQPADPAGVP